MSRLLGALLLGCALTAVASDNISSDTFSISLERTACFGSCPVYKVTVSSDGTVVYEGKEYVRVKGMQRSKVEVEAVKELLQEFVDSDYFKFEDQYTTIKNADGSVTMVSDLPTTKTSLIIGTRQKRVVDYIGAPKKLKALEAKIDEAAGTKRWVAIDATSIREEVQHGWNVNNLDGRQLLLAAVRKGDDETVKAFIQAGADVKSPVVNIYPLQWATEVRTMELLIAAGAKVNATTKEFPNPPLWYAAERGDASSIKALIDAGANVNTRGENGATPLMKAAGSLIPEAVQVLLQAGAQSDARDSEGCGAIRYARSAGWHQREYKSYPDVFREVIPGYQENELSIVDLLLASGATDDPIPKEVEPIY